MTTPSLKLVTQTPFFLDTILVASVSLSIGGIAASILASFASARLFLFSDADALVERIYSIIQIIISDAVCVWQRAAVHFPRRIDFDVRTLLIRVTAQWSCEPVPSPFHSVNAALRGSASPNCYGAHSCNGYSDTTSNRAPERCTS